MGKGICKSINMIANYVLTSLFRSSMSLPRTSSRASFKFSTLKYILPSSKEKQRLKELEANGGIHDTPDSELDSGISVNGNYDDPRQNNHPPEIYERIDELQSNEGEMMSQYFLSTQMSADRPVANLISNLRS